MELLKSNILNLILFLFLVTNAIAGELVIYKTYEDFQNKKPLENGEFISWRGSEVGGVFTSRKNGKLDYVKTRDIWGFLYYDKLFRVCKEDGNPARLMNAGKIMYYENGYAHMRMLEQNSDKAFSDGGTNCYVSVDMSTDLISLNHYKVMSKYKPIMALVATYPQYKPLFDCMGKGYDTERIRKCIADFEGVK